MGELLDQLDQDIPDETEVEDVEVTVDDETDNHETDAGADQEVDGGTKPDAADAQGKQQPAKDEPKTVPLAAHIEERNKLKARIAELEAAKKEDGGLSDEDRTLLKELKELKAHQPAKPAPDFAADPKGYIDWLNENHKAAIEKLEKANAEAAEGAKQTQAQMQHQARVNSVLSAVAQQGATFVAEHADYEAALNHARSVRANQLTLLYPDATQEQVRQQIAMEEIQVADRLLQQGKNPAEFAYTYAKTLGYQTAKPNGATPPKQQADLRAVQSLGSGGGADSPEDDDEDGDIISGLRAARREAFGK